MRVIMDETLLIEEWQDVPKKAAQSLFNRVNMVRARVVAHPSEWHFSGYNEIQAPRERYSLIDCEGLMGLLYFKEMDELADVYREWIEELVGRKKSFRDSKWTESVAMGK